MMHRATILATWALVSLSSAIALASPSVSTLKAFDASLGELPESVSADDAGNLFVSVGGKVGKFSVDHTYSTIASVPIPTGAFTVGIKVGPDNALYVASGALTAALDAAAIWRVTQSGDARVFAALPAEGFPNDMAFDKCGEFYVTDSFLGLIWKIDRQGHAQVWFEDPLLQGNPAAPVPIVHFFGANGIAFDAAREHLYISNTDYGRIMRIRLHGGNAGKLEVIAESDQLKGADGIALDRHGTLYVAVNALDRIATVDFRGNVATYVEGTPLDAPSSVVFGTRPADRHSLFLTSFSLYRANGLKPGSPQPALQSVPVPFGGVDLD